MPAPLYLTKGELRAKLLIRLGYGGLGAGAGMFVPIADDLLEEAQEQLFQIFTDEKGVREWEFPTGVNQRWYDIPLTCDIDRIMGMYAQQNGDYWHPLTRGIGPEHDSDYEDIEDYPYRYDIRVSNKRIGGELQPNGSMTTTDTSATGATGFSWQASNWEISGEKLRNNTPGPVTATSSAGIVVGDEFEVTYTIEDLAPLVVVFGGQVTDVAGVTLPVTIGTHTHRVVPSTAEGIGVHPSAIAGTVLDNISVKKVLEAKTQIEVWPRPDDNYLMKIEGPMVLGPFVADGDRASFDSRLILLYAVAYGKAHLNRQDAKSAMDAWTLRLSKIKANQHGTREYVRRNPSRPEREVYARPKVV